MDDSYPYALTDDDWLDLIPEWPGSHTAHKDTLHQYALTPDV